MNTKYDKLIGRPGVNKRIVCDARPWLKYRCPAGSVSMHLIRAAEQTVLPRALIVAGQNLEGATVATLVEQGGAQPFDPESLDAI